MDKYLIIGRGYIGTYLNSNIKDSILTPDKLYRFYRTQDVIEVLKNYPDYIVINAAGTTGRPNIDWCETNKAETVVGNIALPLMIAEACEELDMYLINIGSGCIYDGYEKEWTEEDVPNFEGSFYSKCKKISQELVSEFKNTCTLRIRMPISETMGERCLISKLVKYSINGWPILSDRKNSMTYLGDLASSISAVAEKRTTGTFNVVNDGPITPVDTLRIYKEIVDNDLTWTEMKYNDFKFKAERSNCVLSNKKIKSLGVDMPSITKRISDMLKIKVNKGEL